MKASTIGVIALGALLLGGCETLNGPQAVANADEWRDGECKATAAPTGEAPTYGIDRADVEAGGEEEVEELRQLRFGHPAKWRGDEARRAAADEHEGDVSALHAPGDLADPLRGGE